ncbi:cytochrome c biogenesis protein [Lyngbya confervoides]|uniref:Cytochrome c biogenesis protein CcsB n=1 Tax=Lyngbya confervoides BDU141951 TaxID=1574623 RepID=A0ABD4SZ34_9CYAN|nr:cytochrome c biogenesis protein [Lyngbya confervoides]MCM1981416.1 cytochrome c biogenesis protein [Lyngbya confervoides BDU141951]
MTPLFNSDRLGLLHTLRKGFRENVLPILADLRLAIILLLLIAGFSITGTVIEQGQSLTFYQANYPESPALFGFLTWKVLVGIGLDHVYRTWWFLALLILFGASLVACTFTHQLPALTSARRWKFYRQPRQFEKLALSTVLPTLDLFHLQALLQQHRYRVYQEGSALYARKGIAGRVGPIIVHISLLLILLSGIVGALGGFMAQEMVPSGQQFQVRNIVQAGPFAQSRIPQDWGVKVNRFWIDYLPDGSIDQFYSDLSVIDSQQQELKHKTIHVNQPLSYGGVTFYQTDWAIAAAKVRVNNSPVFQLPMASLSAQGQDIGRIWGTWVPIKPDMSAGVTLLARDLQGTVMVYDTAGNLVSSIRTGIPLEIEGIRLTVDELVGSTGLQIKSDPGIPLLYLGCGLLILGVLMSYVSHSQIWALSDAGQLYLGGRTNRAQLSFERELVTVIEACEAAAKTYAPQPEPSSPETEALLP